jgi:hypothetical protein
VLRRDRFEGDAGSGGGGENEGWFHAAGVTRQLEWTGMARGSISGG